MSNKPTRLLSNGSLDDSRYKPRNSNPLFNNQQFIKDVVIAVEKKRKSPLSRTDIVTISDLIKKMDANIFNGYKRDDAIAVLADTIKGQLDEFKCEPDTINMHEILKGEIGIRSESNAVDNALSLATSSENYISASVDIGSILGLTQPSKIQQLFNPQSLIAHNYIVFDSRNRSLSTASTTDFSWNYITDSNSVQTGSVTSLGIIRDIVGMRIFPIRIPNITNNSDNEMKRISVLVKEFIGQSYVGPESRNYHFIMEANTNSGDSFIDLSHVNDVSSYFYFNNPITKIDGFTFNFGNPFQLISFPTDRLAGVFTYGASTTITFSSAHNLQNGDRVYISNFTTNSPTTDSVTIAAMNNANGLLISGVTSTAFNVSINTSGTNNIVGQSLTIYFGRYRIIIHLELLYLRPDR